MQFRSIIGQEAIKQRLRLSVQEGRIPHAQLLYGPSGVGKLQLAIAYAQYINCANRTEEDSCGQCPTCLQYQKLQNPDLHFAFPIVKTDKGDICDDFLEDFRTLLLSEGYFDLEMWYTALGVETKQGIIYEKESGEILRKLSLKAYGDGKKIMIIWLPEKMNIVCSNKLLKLLEEPPQDTVFLMVSEHPEQLLSTILSRVQQIRVPKLSEKELTDIFGQDIAHIANGSYLLARQLHNQVDRGKQMLHDFVELMRDAYTVGAIHDPQKKVESLQKLRKWSMDMADAKVGRERQKAFLQYAQRQIRENYIYNCTAPQMNYQTQDEGEFSVKFARFIHDGNVEKIMFELEKAEQQISQNGNAKMIFFDLCLQMIVLIKKS